MAVLTVPVLVASLMCCWRCQLPACCRCQLPDWSIRAGVSCRLGLLQHVPVAGLMPVLVACLGLCCRCQLPGPATGLVSCCRC
uniref:Uncharacterized protein n=1 Tax=Phytophthora fragariae TaxID=53985 RepID=A0A6A3DB86_9STRA|nr:hypothetical protein PF009_g33493 [Phytophthora fragariae]